MATRKQLEAARIWRTAEGKALTEGGPLPTRRQVNEARSMFYEGVAFGDLPLQLQPLLRRTLQHYYFDTPQVTDSFTRQWNLSAIDIDEEYDVYAFDQNNIDRMKMGDTFVPGGLPSIGRGEPYPQIGLSASGKMGRVGKKGEAFGTYWETIINQRGSAQSVNLIRDSLSEFGRAAANENEIQVAKLLVNATGFQTASGKPLNSAHALTANPDLQDPLKFAAALGELAALPVGGIEVDYTKFVVLTTVAQAPLIRQGIGGRRIVRNPGSTAGYSWEETIDFGAEVEVVPFRWLKTIWPSIGKGSIIVPVPEGDQLPVLTRNRLEGYEEPSLWVKDSNAREVGGGIVDAEEQGDFDSDSMWTKVRHVTGASALWVDQIGYTTGANA